MPPEHQSSSSSKGQSMGTLSLSQTAFPALFAPRTIFPPTSFAFRTTFPPTAFAFRTILPPTAFAFCTPAPMACLAPFAILGPCLFANSQAPRTIGFTGIRAGASTSPSSTLSSVRSVDVERDPSAPPHPLAEDGRMRRVQRD
nr:unnamed protein product [Spirometra erinaceieuropaei]